MIVKRNRGREWLDWQRRMVTGAQYIGAGMCLLLLLALFFGEMGLPRYFSMRDHAQQLGRDIQDLQRATTVVARRHRSAWSMILRGSNSWRGNGLAMSAKVKRCISWFPTAPRSESRP